MKKNLINLFLGLSLTTTSLVNAMERDELFDNNHSERSIIPQPAPVDKLENLLYFPLPLEIIEKEILPHSPLMEWSYWVAVCQTCKKFLPFLYQFSGHIPFKVLQKPEMIDHLPKFTHLPLHEQVYAVTYLWLDVILEFQKSEAILEFPQVDRRREAFNEILTKPQQVYGKFYNATYEKDKDGKDLWQWETNSNSWRKWRLYVEPIKSSINRICSEDIGLFVHTYFSEHTVYTFRE